MEIGLTGASGFLGREIINQSAIRGDSIIGFSRNPHRPIPGCTRTEPFGAGLHVNGLDAVVHLAGEPIFGVWTKAKKERIFKSRVEGTRWIVKAIQGAPNPPKVLVCASAVGIYGDRGDEKLTERHTIGAGDFLTEVSKSWEAEAQAAAAAGTRVVCVRISIVLGAKGSLAFISSVFRMGLGGRIGKGDQWMSWIHIRDIADVFLQAIRTDSLCGPVNGAAPNPVRNSEFTKMLGIALDRPTFFTIPSFVLRTLFPEQSGLLLDSQRLVPEKLVATGFQFQFPSLPKALADLIKSKKTSNQDPEAAPAT